MSRTTLLFLLIGLGISLVMGSLTVALVAYIRRTLRSAKQASTAGAKGADKQKRRVRFSRDTKTYDGPSDDPQYIDSDDDQDNDEDQSATQSRRFAYVTFMCKGDSYLPGALVVAYSLKKVQKTKHPVIIIVTPDVSAAARERLAVWFDRVIEVPYLKGGVRVDSIHPRFKYIFTKLQLLRLTEYDKLVYIDADLMPLRNFDALFDVRAPAGKISWHDDIKWLQRAAPMQAFAKLKHGDRIPEALTSCTKPHFSGINAGLMVLRPSEKVYRAVRNALPTIEYRCIPEQRFLTLYYSGQWSHVDMRYNQQVRPQVHNKSLTNEDQLRDAYGIHFVGDTKPWDAGQPSTGSAYADKVWAQMYSGLQQYEQYIENIGVAPKKA